MRQEKKGQEKSKKLGLKKRGGGGWGEKGFRRGDRGELRTK